MMPHDGKKRGSLVAIISKRIKDKGSYEDMMPFKEEMREKEMEDGAEVDMSESAMDSALDSMISAIESKDKSSLKSALKSIISMLDD